MAYPILLLGVVVVTALFWSIIRKRPAYPPGPPRLPLLGNALVYPKERAWERFSEWSKQYGDIIYLNALGTSLIIIHSQKVARELLDKRSAIYSDRPRLMMSELCGYGLSFSLQPYGEEWRAQRKMISHHFSTFSGASQYQFVQENDARKLALYLLEDGSNFHRQMQLRLANMISRATFGFHLTSEDDIFFTRPLQTMDNFVKAATPGNWIVDFLPLLRYLPNWTPGAGFLRTASDWLKLLLEMTWEPYVKFKHSLETGSTLMPNLCADVVDSQNGQLTKEEEWRLALAASAVIGGGLDTNMSTISTFFLQMIHHPEIQKKAYEEIVRVVGTDRLPTIEDRDSLPYVRSIVTEAMRIYPPATMGVPHALMKDDIYNGMFIPKGSVVMTNIWHMCQDQTCFPDPRVFNPDRYNNSPDEMSKVTDLIFGFGRRVCPGSAFAQNTLFAVIASVLATTEILPDGPVPELEYTDELLAAPKPFKCRFAKRSEEAVRLLRDVVSE